MAREELLVDFLAKHITAFIYSCDIFKDVTGCTINTL